jgi:hypothetical protein
MVNWLLILAQVVTPLTWAKKPVGLNLGPLKIYQEGAHMYLDLKESFLDDPNVLPAQLRYEMKVFFAENPNLKNVEVVMKSIKNRSEIELILDQVVLRFNPKNPDTIIMKWVDEEGGAHTQNFNALWAERPMMFLNSLVNTPPVKKRTQAFDLIEEDKLNLLPRKLQVEYWNKVREVLIAAESLNQVFASSAKFPWFKAIMGPNAWAVKDGDPCVIAGWPSSFKNGKCSAPKESLINGQVQCNPAIFGDFSGGFPIASVPNNATFLCNQKSPVDQFLKSKKLQDKKELDDTKKQLLETIQSIQSNCQNAQTNSQKVACEALNDRIIKLNSVTCQSILPEARACADNPLPQVAQTQVSSEPQAAKSAVDSSQYQDCEPQDLLLPEKPDGLNCESQNPVSSLRCRENSSGEVLTRFYCDCGSGYTPHYDKTRFPIKCEPKATQFSYSRSRSPLPSRGSKANDSWFKPWMGITLAAGAGLLLWYWNHKQMMKQYYSMWEPKNPVAPVPPPGLQPTPMPTTPTPAPRPVDVPRPAPTAQ